MSVFWGCVTECQLRSCNVVGYPEGVCVIGRVAPHHTKIRRNSLLSHVTCPTWWQTYEIWTCEPMDYDSDLWPRPDPSYPPLVG